MLENERYSSCTNVLYRGSNSFLLGSPKQLTVDAVCEHFIRFLKAIRVYTMNPWVLVGCGGVFVSFFFSIFYFADGHQIQGISSNGCYVDVKNAEFLKIIT